MIEKIKYCWNVLRNGVPRTHVIECFYNIPENKDYLTPAMTEDREETLSVVKEYITAQIFDTVGKQLFGLYSLKGQGKIVIKLQIKTE